MSVKQVEVDGVGTVSLYKRKGARNIRLSIAHNGNVRVTMPLWAPYKAGVDFLAANMAWVRTEMPVKALLTQGYSVGKAHHIHFEHGESANITTRISSNQIRILLPVGVRWDNLEAQKAAHAAATRALKKEANRLLPVRTKLLAQQHGYTYNSVNVKRLKGRWGSCSQYQDIIYNCFLMQLPWDLIDYVIMHELAHTKVMTHGTVFWEEISRCLPNAQELRRRIKTHKPTL